MTGDHREKQIIEMYCLVYGYSREEAVAQVAMYNASLIAGAVQATKGMSPTGHYARSRLTVRRREWWTAGVRQAQDALWQIVQRYERIERDHYDSTRGK